jgi:starch synthase (maltosyl-transferring)
MGDIAIEAIRPSVDDGRFRAKAVVGDRVEVSADIFRDGPDLMQAAIRYRGPGQAKWSTAPMSLLENDRWVGAFHPDQIGRWSYAIEAWTDRFGTWRRQFIKKVEVGDAIELELEEGALLIEAGAASVPAPQRKQLKAAVAAMRAPAEKGSPAGFADPRVVAALSDAVHTAMAQYANRKDATTSKPVLELTVDRERARFGAWYEFFPRSTGTAGKHGTFKTAAARLPAVAEMGFDVVYLPPIHPIGAAYRKGKNNTLTPESDDVGSPWAIGGPEGGHTAIHPDLGTIKDFDAFVKTAENLGLDVALDYAIQCSPDHPWVTEHPEWFHHRPDGSIKYAENPPKKYQDVYPVNFDTENKEELWTALKEIVDFWISHGVKIFRVDNPHTKPFTFWEWLIGAVQEEHPEVIFLAEAFTRPKVMKRLAKLGFTQSYTYFTWRNEKFELMEYLTELTQTEMADYFRPNFFTNTPDILHEYLQRGGPPAFKTRLVLAAFLSPTYGVYSGYELFENVPVHEGSEEYLDSEKYEIKVRDWDAPGNLAGYITRVNETRRKHASLSTFRNLHFHGCDKDQIIAFSKRSPHEDAILVVVNLNPFNWEEGTVNLDLDELGISPHEPFVVEDIITGARYTWHGPDNYVRLDPQVEPAHIFRIES